MLPIILCVLFVCSHAALLGGYADQPSLKIANGGTPNYTVLGNLTYISDFRHCNLVLSLMGDKAGLGRVYIALAYNTQGVPCVFNYGSWSYNLLSADAGFQNVNALRIGGMWIDATQYPFSNSTTAFFPATYTFNAISLTSPNASVFSWENNQLPYNNYGASKFALSPVSDLLFYVYYFQTGGNQMFGIIAWSTDTQTRNSSYYYQQYKSWDPLTTLFALSGGQVAFLTQPRSQLSIVIVTPHQYNAQIINITLPDNAAVMDAQQNPSNSGELLILLDINDPSLPETSLLVRVDIFSGEILGKAFVLNATCFVVGWQNYVVTAGPNNNKPTKTPVVIQMLTSDDLQLVTGSTYELPFIGRYHINGAMTPISGAFSTGFSDPDTAILYLSASMGSSWIYSVQITVG